ncbi:MAG TPA: ABC transporter permease [Acidimicrobiia bacterium]|nr:ABC transporter permease [Acidimicrobiia bacterium]
MLSTVVAAWRNLVKRLRVDWLILAAAAVTVLLAMVLLAAGPIYADAVTESSLRRTLAEAPIADSSVVVEVRTPPGDHGTMDEIATTTLRRAFAGVETTVTRVLDAEPLQLPVQGDDDIVDLAQVRSMGAIEDHATLDEGTWPGSGVQTAVSMATATRLGLEVGDTLALTDRRDRERQVEVEVVGIFHPDDDTDRYWLGEELVVDGMVEASGFRTHGPFIVDETALPGITPRVMATWRTHPDFDTLEVTEAARLRARVAALPETLDDALATIDRASSRFSDFGVETGLDRLLAGTGRSLTVTRSSVLALLIQLAILAGYALALTAGLLIETRATETSLLRARGVSPGQMAGVAAAEGVLLTVPIAAIAPSVAAWTLEAVANVGPLSSIALEVMPTVTTESRLIVLVAAALAVIGLAWPAWRSARALSGTTRRGRRQRARSGSQRAGVDIALLGLAVLAFWQLQSLGPEVSATVQGRFGVDPVLIAAPTLGLLAGSVLALRIVPLLARLGERIAASGRGSVTALSAWQVARRPLRYARSALLLIMAVAIGFFATSYSSTWLQSQRDQADFQVGADLRVAPNRRTGDSITDLHLLATHRAVPGVTSSMAMSRVTGPVPGSDMIGEFLLLDSAAAPQVVEVDADLTPDFTARMAALEAGRHTLPGIELPGEPDRVAVVLEAVEEEILASEHIPDFGGAEDEVLAPEFKGAVSLVVKDDDDLLHRVSLGGITVNQGVQTLESSLLAELGDDRVAPAYPISVVAIEIASPYPSFAERKVTLDLIHLVTSSGDAPSQMTSLDPETWTEEVVTLGQAFQAARITPSRHPDGALRVVIDTGLSFSGLAVYAFRLPSLSPNAYPVVVSSSWLDTSNRQVGEEVEFETLRTGRSHAVVVGAIEAFPSTQARDREVVIADLPTYQAIRYSPGSPIADVDEHWLGIDGDPDDVAAILGRPPIDAREVQGRADRFLALSTDPVALGTIGALSIGFVAAAVFAAVGFAVSATVSARERITEFGLLRALGLSPRQLGLWMTLEQSLLVLSSLAFGTLVGWALTTVILPLVTVTQLGTRPIPDVSLIYPWDAVVVLEVSLVLVLAVIVAVMSVLLRRLGLGSLLRVGEE